MAEKVVKAIVLRIAGKDVKVSLTEGKKLYDALVELFDRPVVTVEPVRRWPYPVYPRPYYWWSYDTETGSSSSASYTLRMNEEPSPTQTVTP